MSLRDEQVALAKRLRGEGPTPAGFDEERLGRAEELLRRKREREAPLPASAPPRGLKFVWTWLRNRIPRASRL